MNHERIEKLCRYAIEKRIAINMLYAADGRNGQATKGAKYYISQLQSEVEEIEKKIKREVQ